MAWNDHVYVNNLERNGYRTLTGTECSQLNSWKELDTPMIQSETDNSTSFFVHTNQNETYSNQGIR
jgi:hypothetical protein